MTRKIRYIRVEYDDNTEAQLNIVDIEKITALKDTVDLLEKARYVYNNLSRIFGKLEA